MLQTFKARRKKPSLAFTIQKTGHKEHIHLGVKLLAEKRKVNPLALASFQDKLLHD